VTEPVDTGALLARSYALPYGPRVRLRLARRSDLPAIRALLGRRGVPASELSLDRLVRYDPQRRVVMCASALVGGTETIVGIGAIDLASEAEPDTLVVDDGLTDGLAELLGTALVRRAQTHARHAA
jgi:hypothetical protein